jgi:glycosyltransferase 2 family protein
LRRDIWRVNSGEQSLTARRYDERTTYAQSMLWVKRIFTLTALVCLLYYGYRSADVIGNLISHASPWHLVASILIWSGMHVVAPFFSRLMFSTATPRIGYFSCARIHLQNLPGKYIPGGIWHTVGRILAFRDFGIDRQRITMFIVMENILAITVAFFLGGAPLFLLGDAGRMHYLTGFAASSSIIVLVILAAIAPYYALFRDTLTLPRYLSAVFLIFTSWSLAALSFILFVSAFPSLHISVSYLQIGASYLFSWGVGYVSIFAPQGIGVFEVVAAELLRGSLPVSAVAVLLAGFRVIIAISDLTAWIVSWLIIHGRKPVDQ